MYSSDKNKAINAVDLLNDFVGDVITGTMSLLDYHAKYNRGAIKEAQLVGINKMCLSHLILALTKWKEFYERFHSLIPTELQNDAKQIVKTIDRRKIVAFRNQCVGHIWDKGANRPLLNSEIMTRLDTITDKDIKAFLRWLNNPDPALYPDSVSGISEAIRDKIASTYGITSRDVTQR